MTNSGWVECPRNRGWCVSPCGGELEVSSVGTACFSVAGGVGWDGGAHSPRLRVCCDRGFCINVCCSSCVRALFRILHLFTFAVSGVHCFWCWLEVWRWRVGLLPCQEVCNMVCLEKCGLRPDEQELPQRMMTDTLYPSGLMMPIPCQSRTPPWYVALGYG